MDAGNLISAVVALVPLVIIVFAVRIGSRQAREFNVHTGDTSVLAHITALTAFRDDVVAVPVEPPSSPTRHRRRKNRAEVHHAEAA